MRDALRSLGLLLGTIRFSHSVFALPFLLVSALLAAGGLPDPKTLLLLVACAVTARSAAMAFNRLVDRDVDRRNPRTAARPLATGALAPGAAWAFVAANAAAFVVLAFLLNPLSGSLAPLVLALLLGYSLTKRRTAATHFVLGTSLGCAPLGAWIGVRGTFEGDLAVPLLLGGAVALWVAGFDLIYACTDEAFDRREGLRSIPARIGAARALRLSRLLHAGTVALLLGLAARAGLGIAAFAGIAAVAALLVLEHRLVRADDLSRVNVAFFTVNGWVSVAFLGAVGLDLWLAGRGSL